MSFDEHGENYNIMLENTSERPIQKHAGKGRTHVPYCGDCRRSDEIPPNRAHNKTHSRGN